MVVVLRASQIYSSPGKPGKLPTGKSHFYDKIAHKLEGAKLGPKTVVYTERSLDKLIEEGIAEAAAERDRRLRANADKVAARSESAGREVHLTNEEPPHDVQPRSGSP